MKCLICERHMLMSNIPFTCDCGFTICALCNEILKDIVPCVKCNEKNNKYEEDETLCNQMKATFTCFFHNQNLMLSFCSLHNMCYCENCISHKSCQDYELDIKKCLKKENIEKIIGQTTLDVFADTKLREFQENFRNKRNKIKAKIKSLKKWLAEFDKLYKDAEIKLYNIVEFIRISKSKSDVKIFMANSWVHELTSQFNEDFLNTEKKFGEEIKYLFYGLYGEEKTFNLSESDGSGVFVKEYCFPSYMYCDDTNRLTFTCSEKSSLQSIYFGLPLMAGDSGILTTLELTWTSSTGQTIKRQQDLNAKLNFAENKKFTEVPVSLAITIDPNVQYELICNYSGILNFKAFSRTPLQTDSYKIQLANSNTIYKSMIFGLKFKKAK